MKAAYINQPGPPENIIIGELPTPEPTGSQVLVRVAAAALNPDRHVHPQRHGQDGHSAAVHRRLRSGRRRRESWARSEAIQTRAIACGAPIKACSAGRARLPNTRPSTRIGSIRRPTGVSDEAAAACCAGRHHRAPGPGARRQVEGRRNAVRQRRHRRRRLDGRANGQGDRGARHHHGRQRREGRSCAASSGPTWRSTTRPRTSRPE